GRQMVKREEQRTLYGGGIQGVRERLAVALRRRESGTAMHMARDEVVPGVRRVGEIAAAVRRRMQQGSRLHPVFIRRVDLDAERTGSRLFAFGITAVRLAGERIGRRHI